LQWKELKMHHSSNVLFTVTLYPFNGLFSRTAGYQKGKTSLDLNETRDDGVWDGSGISWSTCKQSAPRSRLITMLKPVTQFLQARCSSWCPANSVKALKALLLLALWNTKLVIVLHWCSMAVYFSQFLSMAIFFWKQAFYKAVLPHVSDMVVYLVKWPAFCIVTGMSIFASILTCIYLAHCFVAIVHCTVVTCITITAW